MSLTPTLKALIIGFAFLVNVMLLIWAGIKIDVLALGMKQEVFNIGLTVLTILNAGTGALLVYLGLKAPTIESTKDS